MKKTLFFFTLFFVGLASFETSLHAYWVDHYGNAHHGYPTNWRERHGYWRDRHGYHTNREHAAYLQGLHDAQR